MAMLRHFLLAATVAVILFDEAGSSGVSTKIVKGKRAKKNQHPFSVSINYNGTVVCGGSLVESQWVLTLAACVTESDRSMYTVVAGDRKLTKPDGETEHSILEIVMYPDNAETINDIALVGLTTAVDTEEPNIGIVELSSMVPDSGNPCSLSSYGDTGVGKPASFKQRQDVTVIEDEQCDGTANFIPGNSICFEPLKRKDKRARKACRGDEGSPIVCEADGKLVQIAINTESSCTSQQISAANISDVISWVEIEIAEPPEPEPQYSYTLGFINSDGGPGENNHIYVCASTPTQVEFSHQAVLDYLGTDSSIEVDGCIDIVLPKATIEPPNGPGVFLGYGVSISSTKPISVYAESADLTRKKFEGTAVFPESRLSTSYVVALPVAAQAMAEFIVVATAYNTTVNIAIAPGQSTIVMLNKNDVFQLQKFQSTYNDSIVTIEASERVAVFYGHQNASISATEDLLYEQRLPSDDNYLETTLVGPRDIKNLQKYFNLQIFAVEIPTSGTLYSSFGFVTPFTIDDRYANKHFGYFGTTYVTADKPFNANVYNAKGDYRATLGVQPPSHYKSTYLFYVPADVETVELTIFSLVDNLSNLRLDGNVLTGTSPPAVSQSSVYIFYVAVDSAGAHTLYSVDDETFGVWVMFHRSESASWFHLI